MKKLTAEQVKELLTKAAKTANSSMIQAARLASDHGGNLNWPKHEITYRNIAGPFKAKACVFETIRFYFDPVAMYATSYGWWGMLQVVNGKLVRNICGYSMQTAGHQRHLDKALAVLGIKPDVVVHTKANIKDMKNVQDDMLERHAELCLALLHCQKKSKAGYVRSIKNLEREMTKLQAAKVNVVFTAKAKAEALKQATESRTRRLTWAKERKQRDASRLAEQTKQVVGGNEPKQPATGKQSNLSLV